MLCPNICKAGFVLVMLFLGVTSSLAAPLKQSISSVSLEMYELNSSGGKTANLCTPNSTIFGCTAYLGDPTRSYPFSTDTITIDIEDNSLNGFQQGYLHNVTPHEVALTVSSQGDKPLSTVKDKK